MRNIHLTIWVVLFLTTAGIKAQNPADFESLISNTSDSVHIAFGKVARNDAVSTLFTVDPKEILEFDQILEIPISLIGRVPGFFDISNLRGLGGSLYIVDGLPRDPYALNLSEVEQITVLKDINSAVLYGSEAINGIVLITTKRGKVQKNKINVTGYYGVSTPAELPRYLSSANYAKLYNEARVNDGLNATYYQSDINGYESGENVVMYPNVDYYSDQFLKQFRPYSNIIAELNGGNRVARYYTNFGWNRSGSYFNIGEGKNSQTNEFNFRANVDLDVNSFIKTAVDASAIFRNSSGPRSNYWSQASVLRPNLYQPLIPMDLIEKDDPFLGSARNIIEGKYLLGGTQQYLTNPIADMYSAGKNENIYNHLSFNNRVDIDLDMITEGLGFHTNLSFDYLTFYNQYINNTYAVYQPKIIGDSIRITNQYNKDSRSGEQYISGQGFQRRIGYYAMVDYDREFNDIHHLYGALTAMGNHRKNQGAIQEIKNANIGLRTAYIYDKRYGIDFSGAFINSVKLPPASRTAFSPSIGLSWIASNEDFIQSINAINHLKFRISAGILHTDHEIGSFNYYYSPYGNSGNFPWFDGRVFASGVISQYGGNPYLSFEKRKEINLGLEGRFFNNMIVADANIYFSSIVDRITRPTTIYPSYYTNFIPYSNFNSEGYRGADFGLALNKKLGDFTIYIETNVLYQLTETLQRDEVYAESYRYTKGRPIDGLYGLEADGFFEDQDDIDNHHYQTFGTVRPGDIKYVDQNNDQIIDENDMIYLGRQWPPFTYGLNVRLGYKNFTLFAIGNGQRGAKRMLSGDYYWIDGNKKYTEIVYDRWTEATKHTATYPRLSSQVNNNNYRNSTFWMYNNDKFLLQRVQVTYDFPNKLTNSLHLNGLSLFVHGNNLLTISKQRKVDELTVGGEPFSRSYAVGLKIKFN